MGVSSEVKRTLVKSPPEIWAELSDPVALARQLSELGEVRIVRTVPERAVDWESPDACGHVQIEASGWGTKVTLSATRTAPATKPEPPGAEAPPPPTAEPPPPPTAKPPPSPTAEPPPPQAAAQPPPPTAEPPAPRAAEQTPPATAPPPPATETPPPPVAAEPTATAEARSPATEAPSATVPQPKPRRGLFARLFRRRRVAQAQQDPRPDQELTAPNEPTPAPEAKSATEREPASEPATQTRREPAAKTEPETAPEAEDAPEPELAAEPEPAARAEPAAGAEPEPVQRTDPGPAGIGDRGAGVRGEDPPAVGDIAAELAQLEEQTTAVLTGVLDRLGAAHHRPFSRA